MKTKALILAALIVAVITWFRYPLIVASVLSFATWCVLVVSNPGSFAVYWHPALVEYWIAGVAWISALLWLSKRLLVTLRAPERHEKSTARKPWFRVFASQRLSLQILGLIGYVALASPFLVPVDPNVQGRLVTTRLLPPLSGGSVREYLDEGSSLPGTGVEGVFSASGKYLLNRIVEVSGGPDFPVGPGDTPGVVREFRMIFLFGTDDNARDVFSRVVAGTRISLGIGLCAALGALLIGGAIGFLAGMSRGVVDVLLMRLTDIFLAIPGLFLVIGVLAFVGGSIPAVVIVLACSGWMGIARIVRGEVVSLRKREFILAAKLLQIPSWKIVWRHLVPNVKPVLLTSAVLQFANAVLGEAALGFLGLGIQPPTPSWGNMMGEATGYLGSAWWVGVFPGVLLAAVIVIAHSLGEGATASPLLQSEQPA